MEATGPSQRPCASSKLYDVFINHRGPDVKNTLAIQLYKSLEETGCRAFLDSQEMEEGDYFPSTIENAIWSSTVQIAIFSKRYAESFWCLEELCLMLETKVKLIPVFYDVAPQDLRYIQKGEYASAFENYEKKGRYPEKLQRWKNSLNEASLFTGYDLSKDNNLDYEEQCKKIASKVSEEVVKTRPPIEVAKYPVGLNELVEAFERRCQMGSGQKVGMVGIFGSGGMGKTTLAKELFNRKRSQYSKSCFLSDVREASSKGELPNLQSKLLHDLLKEKFTFQFQNNDERKSYLRRCLKNSQSKHFLLVVDDIDNPNQLDSLLEIDSLPSGSLVLITTRDEGVLKKTGITLRYKMPRMKEEHSKELFCLHAFRQRCPASGHEVLVESFVKVCAGLPLSLRVLGGHVHGHEKHYWQLELDKVSKMLPDDIIGILKVSFEALESEQQQIFMDIACFFEGKSKNTAMKIWEGSGWNGEHALYTLIEKCLVEVESRDDDQRFYYQFDSLVLKMHDSLRDLGRRMADEGGERDNPRRIWRPRDLQSWGLKGFRNILTEAKGQSFRCLINLTSDTDTGTLLGYFLGNSNNFAQTSTSLLSLRLQKKGGQLNSIPSWIPLQNLQCLSIVQEPCSVWQNICQRRLRVLTSHNTQLWKSVAQAPVNLKKLQLYGTQWREFPHYLGMLTRLEELYITRWCKDTVKWSILSDHLSKLTNLRILFLGYLKVSGEIAFGKSGLASQESMIETIHIKGLKLSTKVSISGKHCPKLKALYISNMSNLSEMDLTAVTSLNSLLLENCRKLKRIAKFELINLTVLSIIECQQFEELPSLATLSCLNSITIDGCHKLHDISDIEKLKGLKHLHLSTSDKAAWNCIQMLQRIPSEFTTVIGRAGDAAGSIMNENLFSQVIGLDAVSEIQINEKGDMEAFLKYPQSLSDIIVCAVVQSPRRNQLHAPPHMNVSRYMRSSLANGEVWILTIVLSTGGEINKINNGLSIVGGIQQFVHYIDGFFKYDAKIKSGYIATVKRGEEWKTTHIFRNIISSAYQVM